MLSSYYNYNCKVAFIEHGEKSFNSILWVDSLTSYWFKFAILMSVNKYINSQLNTFDTIEPRSAGPLVYATYCMFGCLFKSNWNPESEPAD